jgi:transposase
MVTRTSMRNACSSRIEKPLVWLTDTSLILPLLPTSTPTRVVPLNAILYVAEHGCKWRGVPKRFGNWHTIYTRMNRWSKSDVLDRIFEQLQHAQIVRIRIEAVSLDRTLIKVHPDSR